MTEHELRDAMKQHFGSFGEVCYHLADYRKNCGQVTDNEIEQAFICLSSPHRRCFNMKAYIASCREPD